MERWREERRRLWRAGADTCCFGRRTLRNARALSQVRAAHLHVRPRGLFELAGLAVFRWHEALHLLLVRHRVRARPCKILNAHHRHVLNHQDPNVDPNRGGAPSERDGRHELQRAHDYKVKVGDLEAWVKHLLERERQECQRRELGRARSVVWGSLIFGQDAKFAWQRGFNRRYACWNRLGRWCIGLCRGHAPLESGESTRSVRASVQCCPSSSGHVDRICVACPVHLFCLQNSTARRPVPICWSRAL